ncbi:hypothetical protein DAPPUDRAFT_106201 [Daphnia pulex]|uniref:Uncharacterized protein n=1 Tax=Daphnia pulex TaxID=6669 RepID=E9GTD9_DAPPU|nr:hypothetical protein DAPPUDRAFT_106201 [Daphnia pulex]|eukprot:EFX77376.1 hypothetical protein DAPPUDRAFT_106201 [Daphnia pulex]
MYSDILGQANKNFNLEGRVLMDHVYGSIKATVNDMYQFCTGSRIIPLDTLKSDWEGSARYRIECCFCYWNGFRRRTASVATCNPKISLPLISKLKFKESWPIALNHIIGFRSSRGGNLVPVPTKPITDKDLSRGLVIMSRHFVIVPLKRKVLKSSSYNFHAHEMQANSHFKPDWDFIKEWEEKAEEEVTKIIANKKAWIKKNQRSRIPREWVKQNQVYTISAFISEVMANGFDAPYLNGKKLTNQVAKQGRNLKTALEPDDVHTVICD